MLEIKIFGPGCTNCYRLENLCHEVISENNLTAAIEKVTDFKEYGKYGIMITPGLMVNGRILSQGKIPVKQTLVHWLTNPENVNDKK
jgi:small redox-active disulfide protein 2